MSAGWTKWLDYIQAVRAGNNEHWLGILRIALEHAPEQTKALLKAIRTNDLLISKATGKIANDED